MLDARQLLVQRGYQEEDKGDGAGGGADRGDDVVVTGEDKGDEDPAKAAAAAAEAAKAADDAKRAAEKAEREKGVAIPKERFDQAVGKERAGREAAEKRAKELEEKLASQATAVDVSKLEGELDALEEALDKALADNDPAEKKRLRGEIRAKSAQITDARVEARSAAATALAVEQIRYDGIVSKLETDYPFLNPDVEDGFDAELASEVMELKQAYEMTGLGSTKALQKAVGTLKHRLDEKLPKAKKDETPDPTEKEKAAAKVKEAEDKAKAAEAKRREDAVAAGLKAKDGQPPASAVGATDRTGKELKASELSDEAYDKLPEAEKKRLRGD